MDLARYWTPGGQYTAGMEWDPGEISQFHNINSLLGAGEADPSQEAGPAAQSFNTGNFQKDLQDWARNLSAERANESLRRKAEELASQKAQQSGQANIGEWLPADVVEANSHMPSPKVSTIAPDSAVAGRVDVGEGVSPEAAARMSGVPTPGQSGDTSRTLPPGRFDESTNRALGTWYKLQKKFGHLSP
jgi:hypothetical protein